MGNGFVHQLVRDPTKVCKLQQYEDKRGSRFILEILQNFNDFCRFLTNIGVDLTNSSIN